MGKHDRGRFGVLLDELKASGAKGGVFIVDFTKDDDDEGKWTAFPVEIGGTGRTGEEAMARLMDKRRG